MKEEKGGESEREREMEGEAGLRGGGGMMEQKLGPRPEQIIGSCLKRPAEEYTPRMHACTHARTHAPPFPSLAHRLLP